MKKLAFSFLCDKDPMKMPASGQTRHCSDCSRDIVDFTGMTPQQIAGQLEKATKPCGFMLPWQLDEVNEHLRQERSNFIVNRLSRLAKIAAVVSTPLVVSQAQAQQITKICTLEQSGEQQHDPLTEILLLSETGTALCNVQLEVVNTNGEIIARLKTDANGKIYLDNDLLKHGPLTIKSPELGLEKTFTMAQAAVCITWKTRLPAPVVTPEQDEHFMSFEFRLIKENGKDKKISGTRVEISFYDSTSRLLGSMSSRTDRKGQLKLDDKNLKGVNYILFRLDTRDGVKTAYATMSNMELQKPNRLEIHEYDKYLMGLMG